MNKDEIIYICPKCFQVCDSEIECHQHLMVRCIPGEPGDERRKPINDNYGQFVSRAPRWYLEAVGWVESKE